VKAREVDPLSAFGGIVGLNRALDADTAGAIAETFIECVVAPKVDDDAREVLSGKKNLRLVVADFSSQSEDSRKDVRSIMGGWLVQDRDRVVEGESAWSDGLEVSSGTALRVVTKRQPTDEEWVALRFAWRVCAHVKSNTIVFSHMDRIAAVGAGQMSRVDAVNVATAKAGKSLKETVAASDAFFPFRDGLDEIAAAGATAVVQPGGSVRDEEVIAAADEHGVAMVFAGRRHFRH
jgi:phosphoribosylaminoimidazolecarboxamide formyltransferase/IMP cyclohydrolase